jgi:hypothetical protein
MRKPKKWRWHEEKTKASAVKNATLATNKVNGAVKNQIDEKRLSRRFKKPITILATASTEGRLSDRLESCEPHHVQAITSHQTGRIDECTDPVFIK